MYWHRFRFSGSATLSAATEGSSVGVLICIQRKVSVPCANTEESVVGRACNSDVSHKIFVCFCMACVSSTVYERLGLNLQPDKVKRHTNRVSEKSIKIGAS